MKIEAVQHGTGGVGVGLHEGLGTLQGVADASIAARGDAACQHQQQGKKGEISAQVFHTSEFSAAKIRRNRRKRKKKQRNLTIV